MLSQRASIATGACESGCTQSGSSIGVRTAGSMLVIIPGRCSPPQPQISDSIDLPCREEGLSRWLLGGVADFPFPHAHPQFLPVVGPQQQPGLVETERSRTQQPAFVESSAPDDGRPLAIPGNIDCPIRHTSTRPQTAEAGRRCLVVSCESKREIIGANSKQL